MTLSWQHALAAFAVGASALTGPSGIAALGGETRSTAGLTGAISAPSTASAATRARPLPRPAPSRTGVPTRSGPAATPAKTPASTRTGTSAQRGTASTPARTWAWPLDPRPTLARGFDPPAVRWLSGHRGVDLLASPGAVVQAPADGVVAFAGMVAGRPVLSIDHASGLRSTFEPVVADRPVGTRVSRGDTVGHLDAATDHCAASCLHWGVKRGADYVDPLALVTSVSPILLPMP